MHCSDPDLSGPAQLFSRLFPGVQVRHRIFLILKHSQGDREFMPSGRVSFRLQKNGAVLKAGN